MELARPGNEGLQSALVLIEEIMQEHGGLSMADAIQLGGAVAVEALGGPSIDLRMGRQDIRVPPPSKRLPTYDTCSSIGPHALLDAFRRMGLSTRQGVALCAVHPFGRFWSSPLWPTMESLTGVEAEGGSPRWAQGPKPIPTFDVEIYRDVLEGRDPLSTFLLHDPKAQAVMEAYLAHPDLWLSDYAVAFAAISEAPLGRRDHGLLAMAVPAGVAAASVAVAAMLLSSLWRWRRRRAVGAP